MKRFMTKKVAVVGIAAVVAVGIAGGALAFFTATGAGNGTATVGTTGNNVAVEGTSTPALVPGESTTMSFTAYNYSDFNQAISSITLSGVKACSVAFSAVATDTFAHATAAPTCSDTAATPASDATYANAVAQDTACANSAGTANTNWFSMPVVNSFTQASAAEGDLGPNASGVSLTPTGTITMNDLHANQDACQGLFLNFSFTTA